MDNGEKKEPLLKAFEALKILPNPTEIANKVKKLKKAHPRLSAEELSHRFAHGVTWRLTGAGVVASLPGAILGLGTVAQLSITSVTITGETWLMLRNLSSLQYMIAAIMGHDPTSQDRKDELLVVWGLTTGLIVPVKEAVKRIGSKIAVKQFNRHVAGKVFMTINRKLGTTVLTKFGTKRGGIAVGRVIPFGVGSLVGGGMNYVTAHGFAKSAVKLYTKLIPDDEEVYIKN